MGRRNLKLGYDYWLNELKRIINVENNGEVLNTREISRYNIPNYRWYIDNCNNSDVHGWNDFVRLELMLTPTKKMNKNEAVSIIKRMVEDKGNELYYDDFRCDSTQRTINIGTINRIWGTMNNMKKELGLPIIQEDMISRSKNKDELLDDLKKFIEINQRPPQSNDFGNGILLSTCVYHKCFGGINAAIELCGYKPTKKLISLNLTDDEIINIYKKYIEDNNIVPSNDYAKTIYELPAPITVMRRFNCTWNEFIEMLGYNSTKCHFQKVIANDGTECNSAIEKVVHDFLSNKPIVLNKETLYRDVIDDLDIKEKVKAKRLDWTFEHKDKTYMVELFGMMSNPNYVKNHDFKIQCIKDDNKMDNFIALYPNDLSRLDDIFSFIN